MKLENADTPITVGSSNVELNDGLREHARESILREAAKYFGRLTQAGVHFNKEGISYRCSVNIQMGGLNMVSAESADKDIRRAFDSALNKAAKQLRRSKTELRD
jgi:ribosomal subunit interface protein